MRARCPVRDLIWMSVLLLCHESIALWLQSTMIPLTEYESNTPRFLFRWLTMAALAGPLIYLPCSAVIGAIAAPPASRFEETQAMLLTRLAPIDVCAGRLLAWLWPVISAVLASCALSLAVQLIWRPVLPGSPDGYAAIIIMHLAMLSSVLLIGAIGFLIAMRRRPGRIWERGAIGALLAAGFLLFAMLPADALIRKMDDPTRLIYSLLLVNPAVAAGTSLQVDTLRLKWIYERTAAHEYPFLYPPPLASCALFAGGAAAALGLAAARLRRAYR
jgi:hypothetical protein